MSNDIAQTYGPSPALTIHPAMTVKGFYEQLTDRLGDKVYLHVAVGSGYVSISVIVRDSTVVETLTRTPDVWSRTINVGGNAHYAVDVWSSHDVEAAVPHLLSLIDDVATLVVS